MLQSIEDRGYPTDYLISRIRGRRARLIADWSQVIFAGTPYDFLASSSYKGVMREGSEEGIRRALALEYRWVYTRMNSELRLIFNPFFLYAELRTIYTCLRHIRARTTAGISGVLGLSLLSDEVRNSILKAGDALAAVWSIEGLLLRSSRNYAGIADIYSGEGPESFERELTTRFLTTVLAGRLHPLLRKWFQHIIDSRNILTLFKIINLKPARTPSFIPGGTLNEDLLTDALNRGDITIVLRHEGIKGVDTARSDIEKMLYQLITSFVKKAGRASLGMGPVLEYLWRLSIEAMNLSILICARELDRDVIERELVY